MSNDGVGDSSPEDPLPPPPPAWTPPPEWAPPATPAPTVPDQSFPPSPPGLTFGPAATAIVQLEPTTRRALVWETRVVMLAFLLPSVMAAIVALAQHINGVGVVTRFPVILQKNPVGNLVIGIFAYLPVAATVPLALFLLWRTGQRPRSLGLGWPSFRRDIWPGIGLGLAAFGSEIALLIPLAPLLTSHSSLVSSTPIGRVPDYYLVYGIAISMTTAIAEEVLVNGYLLVRLEQLGWSPGKALALSLVLRTSYHVYYGVGFILTVPFGYFVTRSFQKNRRLNRPIAAHFMFDAFLFTLAILT
jgi:membrane protease YdiL (CAAX protease family)